MGAGRSASYGMRTVRRERAHVPLSLLAPVHRRLSQPLKVSAKTHNVYFSRHGYDRPAFATLGRRQAAGSAAVDSSSPRPLAAAFRQDSDLPPSSPLSIRDPHVRRIRMLPPLRPACTSDRNDTSAVPSCFARRTTGHPACDEISPASRFCSFTPCNVPTNQYL
jgi:hypothetical protein